MDLVILHQTAVEPLMYVLLHMFRIEALVRSLVRAYARYSVLRFVSLGGQHTMQPRK